MNHCARSVDSDEITDDLSREEAALLDELADRDAEIDRLRAYSNEYATALVRALATIAEKETEMAEVIDLQGDVFRAELAKRDATIAALLAVPDDMEKDVALDPDRIVSLTRARMADIVESSDG